MLSLAEQAEAFGAILDYALEGVPYDGTNPAIKMLMAMIASQIDQHNNKYAAICEKRAEVSKSRWNNPKDANASKSIQKDANASKSKGCTALHHDNDSDCDSDNDSDCDSDNKQDKNLSSFGVKAKREGKKSFNISSYLESKGVQPAMIEAWLAIRKTKRATNTEAAMQLMEREIGKVKMTWDEVIQECVLRNWVGFKAEWILKDQAQQAAPEGREDMDAMVKKWRQELEAMRAADGREPGQFKDL